MSKHETPMVRRNREQVGGTRAEEVSVVRRTATNGARVVDALILPDGPRVSAKASDISLRDQYVIVVQAEADRLGMYLMGQAFFSRELLQPLQPQSVRTVALCSRDDTVLRPVAEKYGIEVVVLDIGDGAE